MSAYLWGCALWTPLGHRVDEAVRRLLAGERAAQPNARFDAQSYACTLGAHLMGEPPRTRARRFLSRMGGYALAVAEEALEQSGVVVRERLGLFCGIGGLRPNWDELLPGLCEQSDDGAKSWARGLQKLHPFWLLQHLSNSAHAQAAMELDARGEGATFGGANSGVQALAAAIRALQADAVDAALVFAFDSLLDPEILVQLAASGTLTSANLDGLM